MPSSDVVNDLGCSIGRLDGYDSAVGVNAAAPLIEPED